MLEEHIALAHQYITWEYRLCAGILESALGPLQGKEILKVQQTIRTTGFSLLENIDPKQVSISFRRASSDNCSAPCTWSKNRSVSALPPGARWM